MNVSSKHKKTIAVLIGAMVIIGGVINSFKGNHLSAKISEIAIREYVEEQYSALELGVGEVGYNFKFNEYSATVKSKNSEDTHFSVYCRFGKVTHDDYDSDVVSKFNTLKRLEDEYSKQVMAILADDKMLKNNTSMVVIENWETEKNRIKLDALLDTVPPESAKLIIRLDMENPTIGEIASVFERSLALLNRKGYSFKTYDLFSEYNGKLAMVNGVKQEDIVSGDLEKILEESKGNGEQGELQISISNVDN